ncbi:MAG: type II toxin-antitoxin system RelE/ParE family toxin [Chloroflexota bacterium]|nr:MAG: type II toxin-antitoxin system RelE/ParE family toxin [Chloroflexota bacterium]
MDCWPEACRRHTGLPIRRRLSTPSVWIPRSIGAQIVSRIEALATDPYPAGCRRLADIDDHGVPVHRIRSGDYRVLYVVRNPDIVVLDIGNRKDMYKGI